MSEQVTCYLGVIVDHLYENCPGLQRSRNRGDKWGLDWVGMPARDLVDPLGTDICGWCRRVWIARNLTDG